MKKLKWWHWALIAVFGITALGYTLDPQADSQSPAGKTIAKPEFKPISGDDVISMLFDPGVDRSALPDIAREYCGSRNFCKIMGWTDPAFIPHGFPMTDREVEAMAFSYSLNRDTGLDQALWDCRGDSKRPKSECLASDPAD